MDCRRGSRHKDRRISGPAFVWNGLAFSISGVGAVFALEVAAVQVNECNRLISPVIICKSILVMRSTNGIL